MTKVAVTHEKDGEMSDIAWFNNIADAERYISLLEHVDSAGVWNGDYGVDAPEERI